MPEHQVAVMIQAPPSMAFSACTVFRLDVLDLQAGVRRPLFQRRACSPKNDCYSPGRPRRLFALPEAAVLQQRVIT